VLGRQNDNFFRRNLGFADKFFGLSSDPGVLGGVANKFIVGDRGAFWQLSRSGFENFSNSPELLMQPIFNLGA